MRTTDGMMVEVDRAFVAKVTELTRERVGEIVQAIMLFGSFASGAVHRGSDVDLLVVVDPPSPELWHPSKNVELRKNLERLYVGAPRTVDVWVRTSSQYADAAEVFGGVEYFAWRANHALYWREPRHAILPPRRQEDIESFHVTSAFDDAMRLLGQAARCADPAAEPTSRRLYYLHRSVVKMLFAYCAKHKLDAIRKGDSIATTIHQIAAVDSGLAETLLALSGEATTLQNVRRMHRLVLGALLSASLRPAVNRTMHILQLSDAELRALQPLKA